MKFDIYDSLKDYLEETYPDDVFIMLDGFDSAVVGVSHEYSSTPSTLVYSKTKMIDGLMSGEDKMDWETAVMYLETSVYNIKYPDDHNRPIFLDDELFIEEKPMEADSGEEEDTCGCLDGQHCETCDPTEEGDEGCGCDGDHHEHCGCQ